MLTLYYSPGACSMASHIGLSESGAPFETKPVALAKGEQKTEAYLKVNPRGKVPALDADGKILTENTAILHYIADRFPEKKLTPSDPIEAARCISTCAWLSNTVHPSFTHIFRPERFASNEAHFADIKETGRKAFWAKLQEIDGMNESGALGGAGAGTVGGGNGARASDDAGGNRNGSNMASLLGLIELSWGDVGLSSNEVIP